MGLARPLALTLLLAAACGGLPSAAAAMTVRKFQELDAAASGKPDAAAMDMYLRGLYEGIAGANADAARQGPKPLFCMPGSVVLAPVNIREMIKKRVERLRRSLSNAEHEALLDSELGLFVLDGLREGFPCGV